MRVAGGLTLLVIVLAASAAAPAQPAPAGEGASEQAFVEALRRADPAAAATFVALREARERSLAELQQAQARYNAAGPELRSAFLGDFRRARRTYAESSLALLAFLDARDRQALAEYQAALGRIGGLLEQRRGTREELERMLRDD